MSHARPSGPSLPSAPGWFGPRWALCEAAGCMAGDATSAGAGIHVVAVIDSLVGGGTERSLAALAPHLVSLGIRLEVVSLSGRVPLRAAVESAGAEVTVLDAASRVDTARRLAALFRDRRPDLVHTMLFEADVTGRPAAAAARLPVVSTLPGLPYGAAHRRSPGLTTWKVLGAQGLDAATARAVRRFHAVSHTVARTMARRLAIRPSKIDVVWRGRDPGLLGAPGGPRRAAARRALGLPDDVPVVLVVARHEYPKGVDVAVAALPALRAAVPGARLVVAGRAGAETGRLEAAIARHGLGGSVSLLGDRTDVADLLCGADVFALPSRWEGLPGAVLEAMALSVPVVASDLPAVRELLPDERFGILVEPGAPEVLARSLAAALTGRADAAARAGRSAERFLRHFTVEQSARGMRSFYERALGRRPAAEPGPDPRP